MIFYKKDTICYTPFRNWPNFKPSEFQCPCNVCNHIMLDLRVPDLLQKMRGYIGRPININHGGGYRCPRHNEELIKAGYEASPVSKHIMGQACDVSIEGMDGQSIATYMYMAGFRRIGIADNWCHGDVASGEAYWHYKSVSQEYLDNWKKRINLMFKG